MTTPQRKHRYKHLEGKRWIEVRIKSPQQLFDVRDPAPFRERDLDDDFVEYVVSSAQEFSASTALKVVIYVEDREPKDLSKEAIKEAIHSYLSYQIELQRGALKRFVKRAQFFLIIGLVFLASCLALAQKLGPPLLTGSVGILREGLVIFGWVSLWKPIELVLFDWYPLFERLRLYKKLLTTEVDIRFSQSGL
ncbi:MAG: hypothetical protein AB7F86_10075 [Bdellovibrionales bacterium]